MSLNVNGYNETFKNFVDFARIRDGMGEHTAIARVTTGVNVAEGALAGRTVTASDTDSIRGIFKWFRSADDKTANNEARRIFREAIADMFGGESRIPASVKKAMILGDYDKGKPLTARRILAVKAAIDADGSAKLNTFRSADSAAVALNKGWSNEELPKIARAARFLSDATGVDEFTAIEQLSTPGSKANRLMNYGGRFMDSAQNFANGLRLMDSFANWYNGICDTMKPVHQQNRDVRDFSPADTFTKLNIDGKFIDKNYLTGLEKFAFEELAANPKANLAETDMEKLFGFKNNKAMAFLGTGYGNSFYSTFANIPKEKRAVVYTALNAFTVPAKNAQEAHDKNLSGKYTKLSGDHTPVVIARILKNFDKAEAMFNSGKLTAKNIIKEFFSEIPEKGNYDYKTINAYFDDINYQLSLDEDEDGQYTDVSASAVLAMQNSGCTFEETVQMLREGKMPPVPKYLSTGSMELSDFDGTVAGGRDLISGDLYRPDFCYHFNSNREKPLLAPGPQQEGFGFKFPGEEKFFTNGTEQGKANITRVGDKVVAMCGAVHVAQANSVMTMLSQSGLSNLRGGLPQIGVTSNEHAAVDYTISKDNETGAVTIKYTSPEALPFKFEWSATVDVNGNVTTTPMTAAMKTTNADNAAVRMNVNLSDAQKAKAANLIETFSRQYNLTDTKLDIFSNFVVRLHLTDATAAKDRDVAEDMAKNIAAWQPIKEDGDRVKSIEDIFVKNFNEQIDDAMEDASKPNSQYFKDNEPDVSTQLYTDANRGIFTINGQVYDHQSADEVVPAFKDAVKGQANRRGISTILNQTIPNSISMMSNRVSLASTSKTSKGHATNIPGIEKFVSRDTASGTYMTVTGGEEPGRAKNDIHYGIDVSKDGKTATVSARTGFPLLVGTGPNPQAVYGNVQYQATFQVDLTGPKPVVTDCKITQDFAAA